MKNSILKIILPFLLSIPLLSSCQESKSPGTALQKKDSLTVEQKVDSSKTISSKGLNFGRYGCTASKYSNGSYEYIPRGFFVISNDGKYLYEGFENPSSGTFTVDDAGNLNFKGGYFDGGKAEKIDRPDKFFLVFPTIPDNRWTCSLIK